MISDSVTSIGVPNTVVVVNIDNGFGAGCIASLINHLPPHPELDQS